MPPVRTPDLVVGRPAAPIRRSMPEAVVAVVAASTPMAEAPVRAVAAAPGIRNHPAGRAVGAISARWDRISMAVAPAIGAMAVAVGRHRPVSVITVWVAAVKHGVRHTGGAGRKRGAGTHAPGRGVRGGGQPKGKHRNRKSGSESIQPRRHSNLANRLAGPLSRPTPGKCMIDASSPRGAIGARSPSGVPVGWHRSRSDPPGSPRRLRIAARRAGAYCTSATGGGFHLPVSASDLGA